MSILDIVRDTKENAEKQTNKNVSKVQKIRPYAEIDCDNGEDGRAATRYMIIYRCPECRKYLPQGTIACDVCGLFFDWSQKAEIVVTREIVWR